MCPGRVLIVYLSIIRHRRPSVVVVAHGMSWLRYSNWFPAVGSGCVAIESCSPCALLLRKFKRPQVSRVGCLLTMGQILTTLWQSVASILPRGVCRSAAFLRDRLKAQELVTGLSVIQRSGLYQPFLDLCPVQTPERHSSPRPMLCATCSGPGPPGIPSENSHVMHDFRVTYLPERVSQVGGVVSCT